MFSIFITSLLRKSSLRFKYATRAVVQCPVAFFEKIYIQTPIFTLKSCDMLKLYEKVVGDETLVELLERADRAKDNYSPPIVIVLGTDQNNSKVRHPFIFSNQEDYDQNFPKIRPNLNGRIVRHEFGTDHYTCLTDIADDADEKLRGQWVIMGYGIENSDGKREEIARQFPTKQALLKAREEILKDINGIALAHQYGTTEYEVIQNLEFITEDSVIKH